MEVYWLEQTKSDVPEENDWLSCGELRFLESLRFAQRRSDWRLGRWTAKRALAACLHSSDSFPGLARIELRPAPSGAPEVFFEDRRAAWTASLSHRSDRAICAVAPSAVELGCDLELIEPRSNAFLADYFTAQEQELVGRQPVTERSRILAVLWSGKESTLKALRAGLRLDTREVIVDLADASSHVHGWSQLHVRSSGGRIFDGWWQVSDAMVRTLVADPSPAPPIPLLNRSTVLSTD